MIITTSGSIEGMKIKKVMGLVKGNTVRARFFVRDIFKMVLCHFTTIKKKYHQREYDWI